VADLNNNVFTLNTYTAVVRDGTVGIAGWNSLWIGGGSGTVLGSRVDRIGISIDTATAMVRGPLSRDTAAHAGHGNTTDAWFGGGYNPSGNSTRVDRLIFLADLDTAVTKGPLSFVRYSLGAHGNTTDAWFGGGYSGPAPGFRSIVDRIIFASDSATAAAKGPLAIARYGNAAHGNTTDAWFGNGRANPSTYLSSVDRVIFASDSATAVTKGPLSSNRYLLAAHGNTTDAWYVAGYDPTYNIPTTTVDRIIFASDTATAVVKGGLTISAYNRAGGGTTTDAWYAGGYQAANVWPEPFMGVRRSTVDRIIFASDTAAAVAKGPLSGARYNARAN